MFADLHLLARCFVRAEEQNGVIVRGGDEVVIVCNVNVTGRHEIAANTPDKVVMPSRVVLADTPLGDRLLVIGSGRHSIV